MVAKLGTNLRYHEAIPIHWRSFFRLVGVFNPLIADTFSGSV